MAYRHGPQFLSMWKLGDGTEKAIAIARSQSRSGPDSQSFVLAADRYRDVDNVLSQRFNDRLS